jgi:tRNA threonylcarbamoyladenosine biosynthesis protein TsaE
MFYQSLVLFSKQLSDTDEIAKIIADLLEAGAVILMCGDLGSGKTAFVKALANGIGIEESVTSPTFTLIDEYDSGRLPLYHMDLYRLSTTEVNNLHLNEYWHGIDFPLGVVAIEWAERLESLPKSYLKLSFTRAPDSDRREITITGRGDQFSKIISDQSLLNFCHRD